MEAAAEERELGDPFRQGLVALAGSAGQIFEWYDFSLFGLLAHEIGASFFPPADSRAELLRAFSVWGSAFFARQLGGLAFSWIGDRAGRLAALRASIALAAVPAVLLVVLPTYSQWGGWATALLVLCRLMQGASVGGELVGAISYALESCPGSHGLLGAFIQVSGSLGGLLATAVVAACRAALPAPAFLAWGWRVPFMVGLALPALTLVLRRHLSESPAFEAASAHPAGPAARSPLWAVLRSRSHRMRVLLLIGLSVAWQAGGYVLFVWVPALLTALRDAPLANGYAVLLCVYACYIPAMLLSGAAADRRVGARRLAAAGVWLSALAFPTGLYVLSVGGVYACIAAHAATAALFTLYAAPLTGLMFVLADDVHTRFTTLALATNVSSAIFGGTAPFVSTALVRLTPSLPGVGPGLYLSALCMVTLASLLLSSRLPGDEPDDVDASNKRVASTRTAADHHRFGTSVAHAIPPVRRAQRLADEDEATIVVPAVPISRDRTPTAPSRQADEQALSASSSPPAH